MVERVLADQAFAACFLGHQPDAHASALEGAQERHRLGDDQLAGVGTDGDVLDASRLDVTTGPAGAPLLSMAIPAGAVLVAALALSGGSPAAEGPESLLERPEPFAAALRLRIGQDFRVLRLSIRPGSADADIQDPRRPANVDRFSFEDGVLGAPEPVQAGRNQKRLEARLFRFADLDLSILPRLLTDAARRAETPEARASQVTIERAEGYGDYESWGRPVVRVVVEGPRGGALVEYNLTGKHLHTNRW